MRRLLVAAAERGEAGTALIERAKGEGSQDAPALDPQQLEKELLLAREAVNCKLRLRILKFRKPFAINVACGVTVCLMLFCIGFFFFLWC